MSQDTVTNNYVTQITTNTNTLLATLLSYHSTLSADLFAVAGTPLDSGHVTTIANTDPSSLLSLLRRLETMTLTIQQALQLPQYLKPTA